MISAVDPLDPSELPTLPMDWPQPPRRVRRAALVLCELGLLAVLLVGGVTVSVAVRMARSHPAACAQR